MLRIANNRSLKGQLALLICAFLGLIDSLVILGTLGFINCETQSEFLFSKFVMELPD